MAGINPQTGLFDPNYNAFGAGSGMAGGYQGSPVDMSMFKTPVPQVADVGSMNVPKYTQTQTPMGNLLDTQGVTPPASGGGMFDNFLGKEGWGAPAIQGASALANSWLGFQNLGVAKDQLSFQKGAYQDQRKDYEDAMARKATALAHS